MLPFLPGLLGAGAGLLGRWAAARFGIKPIKYFIDSTFRPKVRPVPGSVVYCDLWVAVEHSGIHVADGEIANIEVDGLAESEVRLTDAAGFTSKSVLGRKIYVSCNANGPVGHRAVARGASAHVGERAFYGLVIKNCHQFSTRCLDYSQRQVDFSIADRLLSLELDPSIEPTIAALKRAARTKLGASKWLLWDWQSDDADGDDDEDDRAQEPDWQAQADHFRHLPLDAETVAALRAQRQEAEAYEAEIADEPIPAHIRQQLIAFRQSLQEIEAEYDKAKDFLAQCGEARFSYADLKTMGEDFSELAAHMQNNAQIRQLVRKLGRNYIAEEKKRKTRVPTASRSEVHGIHRSADLMRVLPSELLLLDDETLETLFYARLLESSLTTYALQGVTLVDAEEAYQQTQRTGPVVACLDTSGSMEGLPLIKAKALLLATANILKREGRSLHVLLFGASGELREFALTDSAQVPELLRFLAQGFGGGTDFETPLKHATALIAAQHDYHKADILMISDGDCHLSDGTAATLRQQKALLDCSIYTVLCGGARAADNFSDEVIVL